MLAAARGAELGRRTLLLEKNRHAGAKILMSGGTRCNLTHATDSRGIVQEYGPPGRFLHSALAALSPQDLVDLVEREGVATKIEPDTGKIFPASDKASDVLDALLRRLQRSGATFALEEPLRELTHLEADGFRLQTTKRAIVASRVLITTGGLSYPGSGTSGDGYAWAAALGHTIITPRPALTPVTTDAAWVRELKGITIPDVAVRVVERGPDGLPIDTGAAGRSKRDRRGCLAERRGSFLFTHFGLSGPVVLDVSRVISGHADPRSLFLLCDFLPEVSESALDERIKQEAAASGKRQIAGLLNTPLPRRLTDKLLELAGLDPERRAAELGRADRARWAAALKRLPIAVSGTRGFRKAEVTAGGVSLGEVDSRTMESRIVPGLFLAGEVLDLDGPIGGCNFRAAFSTGWLAAEHI